MTDHKSERLWGLKLSFGAQKSCTFHAKKDGKEMWQNVHVEQRCHRYVNQPVVGGNYPVSIRK